MTMIIGMFSPWLVGGGRRITITYNDKDNDKDKDIDILDNGNENDNESVSTSIHKSSSAPIIPSRTRLGQ